MTARDSILSFSPSFRFFLPIAALITYFLGLLLYPFLGETTPILSVLPVVAAGRSLGSRAGLLAALFTTPMNTLILNLAGQHGWDALLQTPAGIGGTAALVFLGVAVGRLIGLKAEVALARAELDHLQRQVRGLRQEKRELGQLSRDLRTQLHAIREYLGVLQNDEVPDRSVQREFLLRASRDAERLDATVEDLFDISLFEEGRLELTLDEFDLNSVIADSVQSLWSMASSKRVRLIHARPGKRLDLRGDRLRLGRALRNLLERAIDVSPPDNQVIIAGQQNGPAMTIQVADRGESIPPETQLQLFEEGGPSDGRKGQPRGASGMALHAVRIIAEAHGGQLGVKSHAGVGSTFYLSLPARTVDSPPPTVPS